MNPSFSMTFASVIVLSAILMPNSNAITIASQNGTSYQAEEQTAVISLSHIDAESLIDYLESQRLLDKRFHWEISENNQLLYFTGSPIFIQKILDQIEIIDNAKKETDLTTDQINPSISTEEQTTNLNNHKTVAVLQEKTHIYRWTDKQGIVSFSDKQPQHLRGEKQQLRILQQYDDILVLDADQVEK